MSGECRQDEHRKGEPEPAPANILGPLVGELGIQERPELASVRIPAIDVDDQDLAHVHTTRKRSYVPSAVPYPDRAASLPNRRCERETAVQNPVMPPAHRGKCDAGSAYSRHSAPVVVA